MPRKPPKISCKCRLEKVPRDVLNWHWKTLNEETWQTREGGCSAPMSVMHSQYTAETDFLREGIYSATPEPASSNCLLLAKHR